MATIIVSPQTKEIISVALTEPYQLKILICLYPIQENYILWNTWILVCAYIYLTSECCCYTQIINTISM